MKRFIYVCAFFLCLCSCSESKYIAEELERTQEIINDYPDSALHSLQAIVPGSIRKKSTKAHYGLLYSLALDKTGQTIDTDSMLRPAVNFHASCSKLFHAQRHEPTKVPFLVLSGAHGIQHK